MLTTLKTYEGVPIGGNNFEDLLSYIRSFLGANFSFSTSALQNNGGYFSDDAFVYTAKGNAWVFTPSVKSVGNLFGRYNNEYYQFNVDNATTLEPQVYKWTILPTAVDDGSSTTASFSYSNISTSIRKLPYRPVKGSGSTFSYGYHDVRFNGIPQTLNTNYTFTYVSPNTVYDFQTQKLYVPKLTLGAEYPDPILNDRYDTTGLNEAYTFDTLLSDYNNTLTFAHTNFSLDFGGHILLYRPSQGLYAYIPQDTSSGATVSAGTYKVTDYSRGIIELNLSATQLNTLITAAESTAGTYTYNTVPFNVISAEQLQEESTSGSVNYYSRYGAIYDGDVASALFVEYLFDGQNHIITTIPPTNYNSTSGSLLFQDTTQQYSDGVILAIKYNGTPSVQELTKSQTTRYEPDVFTLYYSIGILTSQVTSSSDIRAMIEQNYDSWYNRDVLDANYYPVSRGTSTYYSFITASEVFVPPTNLDPDGNFLNVAANTGSPSTVTTGTEAVNVTTGTGAVSNLGTVNVITLTQKTTADIINASHTITVNVTPGVPLNISMYVNSTLANAVRSQVVLTVDSVTYYLQADGKTWSTTAWEWLVPTGTLGVWNRISTATDPVPSGTTATALFQAMYRNTANFTFKFTARQITEGATLYPYQGTITSTGALSTLTSFDPNYAFKIVDTIGLKDLNDVPTAWNNQDTLVYNSSTTSFDATPFTLSSLFDTTITTPLQDEVLTYNSSTSTWENKSSVTSLGYVPVNKAGDTGIGKLSYTASVVSGDTSLTIANKGYTDTFANNAVSAHNALTNVHGATTVSTASRIIIRDSAAYARLHSPSQSSGIYNSGNADYIANQEWVSKFVTAQQSSSLVVNNLGGSTGRPTPGVVDYVGRSSGNIIVNGLRVSWRIGGWSVGGDGGYPNWGSLPASWKDQTWPGGYFTTFLFPMLATINYDGGVSGTTGGTMNQEDNAWQIVAASEKGFTVYRQQVSQFTNTSSGYVIIGVGLP